MTETTIETPKADRATTDVELLVLLTDESGAARDWDSANMRTRKARCTAKQLGRDLGHRGVRTYEEYSLIAVTAAEAEEIDDGDLVVPPFAEQAIDVGLDCALRVVSRTQPYIAGGESASPDRIPAPPVPQVKVAPRGRYVTLVTAPATVDFDDVEEHWSGELRVRAGRERWIPGRWRADTHHSYAVTATSIAAALAPGAGPG